TFENDRVQTKNIAFTAFNTPILVSGEVSHFESPWLNVSAKANNINLNILETIIPEIIKEQGLSVSGTASADIQFEGALAKPQDAKTYAIIDLANTQLESKKLNQNISGLSGHFEYKAPSLTWQNLSVTYQGKKWSSNGSLQNPAAPQINAFVKTEDLSADVNARKKDDMITINTLKGSWFDSTFSVKGSVTLPPGKDPMVDINSDVKLTLRDLPKILPPEQVKQISALNLAGILKIKNHVQGSPQQWQDLVTTTSIETPAFYMMGYQIADMTIQAKQQDGQIAPLTLTGTLYGGNIKTDATLDLKTKDYPFTAKTTIENLSLELLKKDTPLRQQQLAGTLHASADLKGALLEINNMTGQAAFNITKGCLWQLQSISQLLSLISSTVTNGDIVITDASATLKIQDAKVMTTDLTLKSATVSLLGDGWIDFNQNVDFNITPRIEAIPSNNSAINALNIINPTAGIVNIHVSGTLSAPKFEHNASAPQIIKKTLQNTVGSLLKIFE
ncbi:MAG: AsmA-like C-terminal region-containing protein, partial [Candidatus Omnitrophota bacterium]